MSPPVSFTKTKLDYPVFAADFDPYNRGYLIVGGGGGPGNHGVRNTISLLDCSSRATLETVAEVQLSQEEDSITSIANLASKDGLVTLAGINSSEKEQKAGKNEHMRTFSVKYPKRKRAQDKSRQTEEKEDASAEGSITIAGKAALFKPHPGPKPETYQRVLKLSPARKRESGSKRIGVIASSLAKQSEIVVFDATRTPITPAEIITTVTLPTGLEANDIDIYDSGENEFSIVYCTDYDIYEQTITYNFQTRKSEMTPRNPRRFHSVPAPDPRESSKGRPVYRSVRFLNNSQNVLALANKPGRTGADLSIVHLYPTGPGGVAGEVIRELYCMMRELQLDTSRLHYSYFGDQDMVQASIYNLECGTQAVHETARQWVVAAEPRQGAKTVRCDIMAHRVTARLDRPSIQVHDLWQQLAANSLYFEQRALSVGDSSPGKPDRISPGGLLGGPEPATQLAMEVACPWVPSSTPRANEVPSPHGGLSRTGSTKAHVEPSPIEETSASSQDLFSSTSAATETPASNRFSAVFQRPETASSHESRKPSGFDSWRSSVFSRKNSTVSGTTPRLTNEPVLRWLKGDGAASRPSTSYDDDRFFDSEDAFYRNHMKNTISPPFNFQHVTHTQRDHLPEINSTPQNELVSEFWAASAYQAPRSRLQGIKTEDIDLVRRLPGASRRPPPRPEPPSKSFTFRHGPLTGMTVNDSSEDLIQTLRHEDPDAITPAERASQPIQRSGLRPNGLPRQLSSRSYVSQERRSPPTMIHPALRNLDSSPAEFGPSPMGTPSTRSVQTLDYGLGLDVVPEEIEGSNSAQPSPAKPAHEHYRVAPPPPPVLNASLPPLPTQYISSSQGGQNIAQSLTDSKSSATDDARIPSLTSADSWEEDVDFCYFVEAESSCDFEWDSNSSSRNASVISQPFRDSVLTTPTRPSGTRAERGSGDSQMSTQRHVRGKSSIALNSALLFAAFDGSYDTQENVARLSGLGVNAPVPAALTPSTTPPHCHITRPQPPPLRVYRRGQEEMYVQDEPYGSTDRQPSGMWQQTWLAILPVRLKRIKVHDSQRRLRELPGSVSDLPDSGFLGRGNNLVHCC
ncbi:hypothetical protein M8818_002466 [Zalaria obscura]|uniref:Uncharacterized protein n=1 Tax=Zalaria obscura TaxID=2024903 RepID=A0ACC3SFY1_9PEZI